MILQLLRTDHVLRRVLVAVLIIHVLSAIFVATVRPGSISPVQDPLEYRTIAEHVLSHKVFSIAPPADENPDLLRGPGYPLFLASTFVFDRSGTLAIILQQVMVVCCGAFAFLLMRRFGLSHLTSIGLSAAVLFEPHLWLYSLQTMSETFYAFVLCTTLYMIFYPPARYAAAWVGVLLGVSVLIKPSGLILAPFILSYYLLRTEWRTQVRTFLFATLCLMVVLMPWVIRNYALTGSFVLSSSPAYNIVLGLGTPQEHEALESEGAIFTDSLNREGRIIHAFTVNGYADVVALQQEVIERRGTLGIFREQILCAPRVWTGHSYGAIAGILFGSGVAQYESTIYTFGVILHAFVAALFVGGAYILMRDPHTRLMALPLIGMVLAVTLFNACVSYTRMLIPLFPIIALVVGVYIETVGARFMRSVSR
ncbi:glycosyltransferase family 39 protein [Candidatus Nomurabacteria bacterium]|nr:glycosyltransferase family 39 protein [Candidatus Nomurabacteria bacterium]